MARVTRTVRVPTDSSFKRLIASHPLTAYFVLAFGLMWLFAIPLALYRNQGSGLLPYDLSDTVGNVLFLLATFSDPTVAALIVTGITEGRAGVRRQLKRFVQWRVQPRWYIVALGLNLLVWLLAYTAYPAGLWDVVVGVWLIVKGFNAPAFVSQTPRTSTLAASLVP